MNGLFGGSPSNNKTRYINNWMFVQVRAAPPPPKQHPRGQVKRREEVEITLV